MQYAVVMAGGAGTRLWPAARRESPKQLQRLIFKEPLIVETVQRLSQVYGLDRIFVVTAARYAVPIREALPNLPAENVISEPFGRNTAAAIALAALRIARDDPDGVFAVFPADHVILRPEALFSALEFGHDLALRHRVVDIGVPPSHPETGYGYIEVGDEIEDRGDFKAFAVKRFVEKPNLETAREYVAAGTYIWNSGMFIWRASAFLQALQEYLPDTHQRLAAAFQSGDAAEMDAAYEAIEDISVDYAIMEKAPDVVAVPVDFGWRDIGDWAALYDMMEKDGEKNATEGRHVGIDTTGCLVLSPHRVVATIGLQNLAIVETEDVTLIMPRERAQEVKQLLDLLKARDMEEHL